MEEKEKIITDSTVWNPSEEEYIPPCQTQRMAFGTPNIELNIRETKDGEEIRMNILDIVSKYMEKEIWLRVCAYDQDKHKLTIWRPAKIGVFIDLEVPIT